MKGEDRVRRRARQWPFGWLAAAMALAATIQTSVALRSPVMAKDGIRFIQMAKGLDNPSAVFSRYAQHPGYPAMIRAVHAMVPWPNRGADVSTWRLAARWACGGCGLLGLIPFWLLVRRCFSTPVANVAALLLAVLPVVRENGADALSDSPHLLFYLLAVWMACEGVARNRPWWLGAAGAASGLAYWIRPEGATISGVVAVLLVVWMAKSGRGERLRYAWGLVALVVAASLVSAPYIVLSGSLTRKLTQKKYLASGAHPRGLPGAATQRRPARGSPARQDQVGDAWRAPGPGSGRAGFLRTLGEACGVFVTRFVERMHILLVPVLVAVVLQAYPGLQCRERTLPLMVGCFHVFLLFLLYFLGGYIDKRHLIPLAGVAIVPYAGVGLVETADRLADWVGRRGDSLARRRWSRRLLGGLVALLLVVMLPRSLRPLHQEFFPQYHAACWIRRHAPAKGFVVANSPYFSFYGEIQGVLTQPGRGTARWLHYRPGAGVARFFAFDAGERGRFAPGWGELAAVHGEEVFHLAGRGPSRNHQVRVFQLR